MKNITAGLMTSGNEGGHDAETAAEVLNQDIAQLLCEYSRVLRQEPVDRAALTSVRERLYDKQTELLRLTRRRRTARRA